MSAQMRAILESKRKARLRLAALPFTEKVALLEQLRDRTLAIAGNPLRRQTGPTVRNPWIVREGESGNRPDAR